MRFRYSRPPLTQHTTALSLLFAAAATLRSATAQAAWQTYVVSTSPAFRFVGALLLLHAVVFWGLVGGFWLLDRSGKPAFLARTRIQTDDSRRPAPARVARVLAWNQLFWTPLVLYAIWGLLELRGWERALQWPTVTELLRDMAGLTVLSAGYFYAVHRFLHRPWWMKHVHRIHHEFRSSTAIAAEYAHPFEMVFGNFGTMGLGVVVLAPSLFTIYVYALLGTYTFVVHHSGYALPFVSSPVHHDWHHFRYREAFGTFGLLDRLLGTDRELRGLAPGDEVR